MFLTQLRAILRASAFGKVKILIPMLAHAQEIDQTLDLIREAKRQLDDAGIAYDPNVQVGAMIEIPAAAIALPLFLKRLDFLSIGTNDLIQYTLAIDRADNSVAHLYDPLHPAVLHLIAFTLREAKRAGVPVSVCGEMAGDPALTRLLLGMGLTEFSMHPSQLLVVKQEVLRSHLKTLEKPVADVLASFEPEEVQAALKRVAAGLKRRLAGRVVSDEKRRTSWAAFSVSALRSAQASSRDAAAPHTGQSGWRAMRIVFHSIRSESSIIRRPTQRRADFRQSP